MKKITLFLVLLTVVLQGCTGDDCGECFTPPPSFRFEIINQTTGENLFTNGTFQPSEIEIKNILTNSNQPFEFISENNFNIISVSGIGWKTEIVNLKVIVANTSIFNFYADAERKEDDCCSYTDYNEIKIINAEFELDKESGIYTIFVNL